MQDFCSPRKMLGEPQPNGVLTFLLGFTVFLAMAFSAFAGPLKKPTSDCHKLLRTSDKAESVLEERHGVLISDPYRWLEDLDHPRVQRWVRKQNRFSKDFLQSLKSTQNLRQEFEFGSPEAPPKKLSSRSGEFSITDQAIYFLKRGKTIPRIIINISDLPVEFRGRKMRFKDLIFSPDERYLAYSFAENQSRWSYWRFRHLPSGRDLPETLGPNLRQVHWSSHSRGLYYTRYDAPADPRIQAPEGALIAYHRLHQPVSSDQVVFRGEEPESAVAFFDSNGPYFFFRESTLTQDGYHNRYFFSVINRGEINSSTQFFPLVPPEASDGDIELVVNRQGPVFTFLSTQGAPHGRLMTVDLSQPRHPQWKELVPEDPAKVLRSALWTGRYFALRYEDQGLSELRLYDPKRRVTLAVDTPKLTKIKSLVAEDKDSLTFKTESFLTAPQTRRVSAKKHTGSLSVLTDATESGKSPFTVRQVQVPGHDGASIPVFVIHKKRGFRRDGSHPTLMEGYGGFGRSMSPAWNAYNLSWLERSGVLVIPGVRGGMEKGSSWRASGRGLLKQNSFSDFISVAEWLIREGYTSPPRLGIFGSSNGGLLVGAALTQRPELFGAAVVGAGVLDMIRYENFSSGKGWRCDYGSTEDRRGFFNLLAYSPLHNIKPGTRYPATLIVTGDHDETVAPLHSYKFAAALQAAQSGEEPILLRTHRGMNHHPGSQQLTNRLYAEIHGFLWHHLWERYEEE